MSRTMVEKFVIPALVIGVLLWLAGPVGIAVLWGFGAFMLLMQLVGVVEFVYRPGMQRYAERRWAGAAAYLLGGLVAAAALLAAGGYCGYRAYHGLAADPPLQFLARWATHLLFWMVLASFLLLVGMVLLGTYLESIKGDAARGRFGRLAHRTVWLAVCFAWIGAMVYCVFRGLVA